MRVEPQWGTHLPSLREAARRTPHVGPMLELGMGEHSTPVFNELASAGSRAFSYENNEDYFRQYEHFGSDTHLLAKVDDWSECPIESQFWRLALVDHQPDERRAVDVGRLLYRALAVICHDSDAPACGYEQRFKWFRYRLDVEGPGPRTSIGSNSSDVSQWSIAHG